MRIALFALATGPDANDIPAMVPRLLERGATVDLVMWNPLDPAYRPMFDQVAVLFDRPDTEPEGETAEGEDAALAAAIAGEQVEGDEAPAIRDPYAGAPPKGTLAYVLFRLRIAFGWRLRNFRSRLRRIRRRIRRAAAWRIRRVVRFMRRRWRNLIANSRARRAWRQLRQLEAPQRLAMEADMLVAVDTAAVLSVWELARRRGGGVLAVNGLSAALTALDRHTAALAATTDA